MKNIFGLPRNVFVLGLVSLFMDISSEMIYPLIPIFLSDVLHTSKTSIGIIEGVAESTASALKVFSGWLSDKLGKRKAVIFWGYGISVFSRPILASALSWYHVLAYRFTDRIGKGVRTAPRDAIIADSTARGMLGKAFGFHRTMDTVGAVIGPASAFLILSLVNEDLRWIFWISIIPGIIALITVALFVKDTKRYYSDPRPKISFKDIGADFKKFLFVTTVFTVGKTSDAFVVLRAEELGIATAAIPLLYLMFNIVSAALSTPAGIMADKIGKRKTILASYFLFSLIFAGFALASSHTHIWLLFGMYGVFVAINEGVQRAYVATVIMPGIKATGYGVYHTIVGLTALPASIIGGALWQNIGSYALFYYSAFMSLLSCILFVYLIFPSNNETRK